MITGRMRLLRGEFTDLDQVAGHLRFSIERTQGLLDRKVWGPQELERLKSSASRFARLSDLLTQRVTRLVDEVELITSGSLLDGIRRALKRG